MKHNISYNLHNGFINKVTWIGKVKHRTDFNITITNRERSIQFIAGFKLSSIRYQVGTLVFVIARAVIANGELVFELKHIAPINMLQYSQVLNNQCAIALSGFVRSIDYKENMLIMCLMQHVDCYTILLSCKQHNIYIGQALYTAYSCNLE